LDAWLELKGVPEKRAPLDTTYHFLFQLLGDIAAGKLIKQTRSCNLSFSEPFPDPIRLCRHQL